MIPRFLFKHDRFGKPVPTFQDRALRRAGILGVHRPVSGNSIQYAEPRPGRPVAAA